MKLLVVIISIIALVVGFNMFASAAQKDRVYGAFQGYKIERKCFNYYKNLLKDPDSAYLVEYTKLEEKKEVIIKIAAKNSFGGYDTNYQTCPIQGDELDNAKLLINRMQNLTDEYKASGG